MVHRDVAYASSLGDDMIRAAPLALLVWIFPAWADASVKDKFSTGRVVFVPEALNPRIEQSGIALAGPKDVGVARAFLAFLTGEKGRAVLAKNRYGLP